MNGRFGIGAGPTHFGSSQCTGEEESLLDCPHCDCESCSFFCDRYYLAIVRCYIGESSMAVHSMHCPLFFFAVHDNNYYTGFPVK